jgi:hypothetical protein
VERPKLLSSSEEKKYLELDFVVVKDEEGEEYLVPSTEDELDDLATHLKTNWNGNRWLFRSVYNGPNGELNEEEDDWNYRLPSMFDMGMVFKSKEDENYSSSLRRRQRRQENGRHTKEQTDVSTTRFLKRKIGKKLLDASVKDKSILNLTVILELCVDDTTRK